MSALAMMKHACTIKRGTKTNTNGEIIVTYADAVTSQRCLLQESGGRYQSGPGGSSLLYNAILFLPIDADVKPQGGDDVRDQIVMSSPTRLNGRKFLVVHACDEDGMGNHLTAFLERVAVG
jgi:hypothetical protein